MVISAIPVFTIFVYAREDASLTDNDEEVAEKAVNLPHLKTLIGVPLAAERVALSEATKEHHDRGAQEGRKREVEVGVHVNLPISGVEGVQGHYGT